MNTASVSEIRAMSQTAWLRLTLGGADSSPPTRALKKARASFTGDSE